MIGARSETKIQILGTPCHIVVDDTDGRGQDLLSIATEELHRIDAKFNANLPDSLITQINELAGSATAVQLDDEAQSLFQFADVLWEQSNRLYDPSIASLLRVVSGDTEQLIRRRDLSLRLALVDWSILERGDRSISLPQRGMAIDLNSCVRPYAADSVCRKLKAAGAQQAKVAMDHEVSTLGKQPDGANWLVGIRYPQGLRHAITRIKLNNKGYVIRGDYEACMHLGGERFSRALSPVDGQPIPGLLMVAVTADSALAACSAANIARMKTEKLALRWLDDLGLDWFAIDRELNCHGPLVNS